MHCAYLGWPTARPGTIIESAVEQFSWSKQVEDKLDGKKNVLEQETTWSRDYILG